MTDDEFVRPTRDEMLDLLHQMIKDVENMPQQVKFGFVTNSDLAAVMTTVLAIFRAKE